MINGWYSLLSRDFFSRIPTETATRQFARILELGEEIYDDLGRETAINILCESLTLIKTSKLSTLYEYLEYATTDDEEEGDYSSENELTTV